MTRWLSGGRPALLLAALLPAACMETFTLEHPGAGGGGGGANGSDAGPGSGGDFGTDGGSSDASSDNRLHCSGSGQLVSLSFAPEQPAIMFALDRSPSMGKALPSNPNSPNSRFTVTATAISDAINKYTPLVRFGYVEFPGLNNDGTCPSSNGCCAGGLVGPLSTNGNIHTILNQLNQCTGQSGSISCVNTDSTPTGQALNKIGKAFNNTTGSLYALLLTDGGPSPGCMLDPSVPDSACDQTVGQINDMVNPNASTPQATISTFVVAVGVVPADDPKGSACLSAMATAGQHANGMQAPFYIAANTEASVSTEVTNIVKSTICRIDVTSPSQNFDSSRLEVDLNGTSHILPDPFNGWTYDASSKTIIISGDECTAFINSGPSRRLAVKACPDSRSPFPPSP